MITEGPIFKGTSISLESLYFQSFDKGSGISVYFWLNDKGVWLLDLWRNLLEIHIKFYFIAKGGSFSGKVFSGKIVFSKNLNMSFCDKKIKKNLPHFRKFWIFHSWVWMKKMWNIYMLKFWIVFVI